MLDKKTVKYIFASLFIYFVFKNIKIENSNDTIIVGSIIIIGYYFLDKVFDMTLKEGYEDVTNYSGETDIGSYTFDYEKETNDYNNNIDNLPDNSNSTIPYDYQNFKENVNDYNYNSSTNSLTNLSSNSSTNLSTNSSTNLSTNSSTNSLTNSSEDKTIKYQVKYINVLIDDLVDTDILNKNEVDTIRNKLETKITTPSEMIVSLENLLNTQYNSSPQKNKFEYIIKNISINNINQKYINAVSNKLMVMGVMTSTENNNLINKVSSGLLTEEEVINSLEKLHLKSLNKNDMKYNELPSSSMKPIGEGVANDWASSEYTILSTDKWNVPTNNFDKSSIYSTCTCPKTDDGKFYLNSWDNYHRVQEVNINKQWIDDQTIPSK